MNLAINSARNAGAHETLVMGPLPISRVKKDSQIHHYVEEPKLESLSAKLSWALSDLAERFDYITWLGDDDLLHPDSLTVAAHYLDDNPDVALVYGGCDYIDIGGQKVGANRSGSWAKWLMLFGPFLIPQPGSLIRSSAFLKIGGLDSDFKLAFDHDLFVRLAKNYRILHLKQIQAAFRWHPQSLTVKNRWESVREASRVRKKHYKKYLYPLVFIWEPLVVLGTHFAGNIVSRKVAKLPKRAPL